MGNCESLNNAYNSDNITPSFRCTYDIQDLNDDNIIEFTEEIRSKVKILNGKKRKKITLKKIFDKIGLNTIDFIIEGQLTDMSFMLFCANKLKRVEFTNLDASNVTNFSKMFMQCRELEYIDVSVFNTINATEMEEMFNLCGKLKQIKGLENFNTINVQTMYSMFDNCN